MSIRRNTAITLLLFSGLLSLLVLPGCERHRVPNENQMQMGQGSMGKHPEAQVSETPRVPSGQTTMVAPGPRFIVQSGQEYYVDSRGALHEVVRHEVVAGGGLYYLVGDERPYYVDESGRLYYRMPSGEVVYYEDVAPPPAVVIPGQPVYVPAPAVSRESCESQYRECMSGCNGISPRQRYDRPNCISNCEAIRGGCLGR